MSAGTIVAVKPSSKPGQGFAKIALPDGSVLEAWTPEIEKATALNGKPIPDDWSLRDNKQGTGKVLLPPKAGGGGGYRATKEAFDREAASRERWQLLEEERKDRRTAAMTAFEHGPDAPPAVILEVAEQIYQWLRSSSVGKVEVPGSSGPPPFATDPTEGTTSRAVAGGPPGSGPPALDPALGIMSGEGRAPTRRDDGVKSHSASGSPLSETSAPSSGTTSADGEAAGEGPGEVVGSHSTGPPSPGSTQDLPPDAPGPPHYILMPADCDHLGKSGHLLRPRKSPRGPVCPRCGLSFITIMEGVA